MNRLLILCLSAVLLLSACGGDESDGSNGKLGSIKVSEGATPKVTVKKGFKTSKTETDVLKEGAGETVAEGETVKVNYIAVNGRTGKQFDSSFASGQPASFTISETSVLPGFVTALKDQKIGSRVLTAIAPKDGFGQARKELDLKAGDTMVFLFDLVSKVPTKVTGTSEKLPDDLPKLELNDKDEPAKFVKTDDTAAEQTKASADVVIKGKGDKIKLGQTVSLQYVGQIYPSGKVFDSSWAKGTPASFELVEGGLIKCWTDLLPGQRIGSRVVLVCPSDVGYGDKGQAPDIKGGDTLIFAVDLLDAS